MPILRRLIVGTALAPIPLAAAAQDAIPLGEIVVSAGLTPAPAEGYGRASTVLTAADIAARGAATVEDALRGVPGVSVASSGANFTQIRIRGGEARQTLILIDGVEAGGGSGDYVLSNLPIAGIARIEVLRGPQSTFYGADAASGVINIITDRGAPGLHHGATIEVGNGLSASGTVSQRSAGGGLSLNLSRVDDRGFDQSGDGGERDGLHRRTAHLAGDWQATDALRLGAALRWSDEDFDYDREDYGYDPLTFAPTVTDAAGFVDDDPSLRGQRRETQTALWGELSALDGQLLHRIDIRDSVYRQASEGTETTRGETQAARYRLSYGLDVVFHK
ncbi:TonB-dependent receptor [Falsirhodobacter algicola]|uniref:TonB-dependent receptor plug domain-containing protein n=1 Tax=Falsirhodobacter algicola TaxID=2692330 RepID=A0A8J8SKU7_9RHOB|nr:TonB-dependent receptor plug domain-containing protein [Falsirhodobacter algicola]QUS36340.1 TonB-dependent receptor plug domain-containing protein [Falsirhodobacter algicola]